MTITYIQAIGANWPDVWVTSTDGGNNYATLVYDVSSPNPMPSQANLDAWIANNTVLPNQQITSFEVDPVDGALKYFNGVEYVYSTTTMEHLLDANIIVPTNGELLVHEGNFWVNSDTVSTFSANALNSATTTIIVNTASAPITGQVLTATSNVAATWQTPGGFSMIYPGAGIANSTGSAWDTSYNTTGTGNVVLDTNPVLNQFTSNVTTGTPPFIVKSTTTVANLHVDTATNSSYAGAIGIVSVSDSHVYYPAIIYGTGGNQQINANVNYTFTPSTGTLTAPSFIGNVTGTVGATTPATGAFTTLTASGTTLGLTTATALNSTVIGNTSAAAGTFTRVTSTDGSLGYTSSTGTNLYIQTGGPATATSNGNILSITAGTGGATSGTGGTLQLYAGNAGGTDQVGGIVFVYGGTGNGAGHGGDLQMGGGTGGLTGNGGTLYFLGGQGGATSGSGGQVQIIGGTPINDQGGPVIIKGGPGVGSNPGGAVSITGGAGGATSNGNDVTISGGPGGSSSGYGGGVFIQGGTPSNGPGGAINIFASDGVGAGSPGGSIVIGAGNGVGGGTAGTINFSLPATSELQLNGDGGIAGQVITSAGPGAAPTWTTISSSSGNATAVSVTAVSNSATYYPTFVSATSGNLAIDVGTGLTFNPNTNTLTTITFAGNVTGSANNASYLGGVAAASYVTTTTLNNQTLAANVTSLTSSGNITVQTNKFFIGNGSQLTGLPSGMVYPGAGIANSTGTGWGTSYGTTGTGSVVLNTGAGGSIQGVPIGNATPSTGAFTTLSASGTTLGLTTATALNSTVIGNTSAAAGTFTSITGTGNTSVTGNIIVSSGAFYGSAAGLTSFPTLNQNTTGSANNASYLGGVPAANYVTTTTLNNGTLAANVTSLTSSGNITTSGNVTGTHYGSAANLTSFPTLNQNTTGSANNASYLGGVPAANYVQSNQTIAQANNAAYLGGVSAANYLVSGGPLGTPSSGVATNLTGTAIGLTAGNVSYPAQTTITSVGTLTGLTVTNTITGNITGSASSATTANSATYTTITTSSTNATFYPTFVSGTSGNLALNVDSSALTFNPNTNTLSTATFVGNVTGNLTGYASTAVTNAGTTPSIQSGTYASLPAAGTAGRLYVSTDYTTIWRDTGAAWVEVGKGALYTENISTPIASTVTGTNAFSIGSNNKVSGTYASAIGSGANASSYGSFVRASGSFTNVGSAQSGTYVCRGTTSNATQTEIFLDGSSSRILLSANSAMTFQATVVGRSTTTTGNVGGWTVQGVIKQDSTLASTALVGNRTITVLTAPAGWAANVVANTTVGSLSFNVTGVTGQTIRWVATVLTAEVNNN